MSSKISPWSLAWPLRSKDPGDCSVLVTYLCAVFGRTLRRLDSREVERDKVLWSAVRHTKNEEERAGSQAQLSPDGLSFRTLCRGALSTDRAQ